MVNDTVSVRCILFTDTVSVRCTLFTDTVSVRCILFTDTVSVRCILFTDTVSVNNLFLFFELMNTNFWHCLSQTFFKAYIPWLNLYKEYMYLSLHIKKTASYQNYMTLSLVFLAYMWCSTKIRGYVHYSLFQKTYQRLLATVDSKDDSPTCQGARIQQ